jgi:FixJ family two-component response regulator
MKHALRGAHPCPTQEPKSHVYVVDDDPGIRASLGSLFRSVDLSVGLFASPMDLLAEGRQDGPGCLVLDVRLPELSGLDFQERLVKQGIELPIIFMTGHGDIPMTVRAMKAGAVDFLAKPFRDQEMLDAVMLAIARDKERRTGALASRRLRATYDSLTPREREIMKHVTAGLLNKQVAGLLGLSEITVKIHRGHMMRKMNARTLADLVRMAESIDLSSESGGAPGR